MYTETLANKGGRNAEYIPQLAKVMHHSHPPAAPPVTALQVDPELFGVAVCTTAGQRYTIGDADFRWPRQQRRILARYLHMITGSVFSLVRSR